MFNPRAMRRGGNTYNVCHKTGKIEYKDDKGGVARHYIRIGTAKDIMTPNGELNTVFDNDHILLKREIRSPAILSFRFFETERSTLSRYLMPRDHEAGKDLVGYFLEPKGPSTILRNQKQRIPAGLYHMTPNTGSAFPDVPRLYNDAIPRDRGILIHWGNDFRNTTACLLPSHNFKIKVVEEKEKIEDIWMEAPSSSSVKNIQDYIATQGGYADVKFNLFDFLHSNPELVPRASTQGASEEPLEAKVNAQRDALQVAEESGYLLPLN